MPGFCVVVWWGCVSLQVGRGFLGPILVCSGFFIMPSLTSLLQVTLSRQGAGNGDLVVVVCRCWFAGAASGWFKLVRLGF